MTAWRGNSGAVQLSKNTIPDAAPLALTCGQCIGCKTDRARQYALRCQLELHNHHAAAFTTITYDDEHCPTTLDRDEYSRFIKRVRRAAEPLRLRHFGSGEYGEKRGRPHYHAILFGLDHEQAKRIVERAWTKGFTQTEELTPARIAYVAGYVSKKLNNPNDAFLRFQDYDRTNTNIRRRGSKYMLVDTETGELLDEWQGPFLQMSLKPGIGGDARKYTNSWRTHAVFDGVPIRTPRYYEEAWKQTATAAMIEQREYERQQYRLTKAPTTPEQLRAAEAHATALSREKANRRTL